MLGQETVFSVVVSGGDPLHPMLDLELYRFWLHGKTVSEAAEARMRTRARRAKRRADAAEGGADADGAAKGGAASSKATQPSSLSAASASAPPTDLSSIAGLPLAGMAANHLFHTSALPPPSHTLYYNRQRAPVNAGQPAPWAAGGSGSAEMIIFDFADDGADPQAGGAARAAAGVGPGAVVAAGPSGANARAAAGEATPAAGAGAGGVGPAKAGPGRESGKPAAAAAAAAAPAEVASLAGPGTLAVGDDEEEDDEDLGGAVRVGDETGGDLLELARSFFPGRGRGGNSATASAAAAAGYGRPLVQRGTERRMAEGTRRHVENQFRTFAALRHYLHDPQLLVSHGLFPLTRQLRMRLVAEFYSFEPRFMRLLIGTKTTRKELKDVDALCARARIRRPSGMRQAGNLTRIYRVCIGEVEERKRREEEEEKKASGGGGGGGGGGGWLVGTDAEQGEMGGASARRSRRHRHRGGRASSVGSRTPAASVLASPGAASHERALSEAGGEDMAAPTLAEEIAHRFMLPATLARSYARVLFLARYRFVTLKKRSLEALGFLDLSYFAHVLRASWSAPGAPDELDTAFVGGLRELRAALYADRRTLDEYASLALSAADGAAAAAAAGAAAAAAATAAGGGAAATVAATAAAPGGIAAAGQPVVAVSSGGLLRFSSRVPAFVRALAGVASGLGRKADLRDLFPDLLDTLKPLYKSGMNSAELQELLVRLVASCRGGSAGHPVRRKGGRVAALWLRFLVAAAKVCVVLFRRCLAGEPRPVVGGSTL